MKGFIIAMLTAACVMTSCHRGAATQESAIQADTLPDDSVTAYSLVGNWVRPLLGQDSVRGFSLRTDSTVVPINNITSHVKFWKVNADCDTLFLISEDTKTGATSATAYKIRSLDNDSLVLVLDGVAFSFARHQHM